MHLIKYTRNEAGVITGTPCCWVRASGFAMQLKEYLDSYGALSNRLFKIKRTGRGLETTYTIMYLPSDVCPSESYTYDAARAFDGWSPVGSMIRTQSSPTTSSANQPAPQTAPSYQPPVYKPEASASRPQQPVQTPPPTAAERFPAVRPWERIQNANTSAPTPGRPERY